MLSASDPHTSSPNAFNSAAWAFVFICKMPQSRFIIFPSNPLPQSIDPSELNCCGTKFTLPVLSQAATGSKLGLVEKGFKNVPETSAGAKYGVLLGGTG